MPVWQPALTVHEVKQIERVQKCALSIVLGDKYTCYDEAREKLGIERLSDRRKQLCENFAKKAARSGKFKNWFSEIENTENKCKMSTQSDRKKSLPLYRLD